MQDYVANHFPTLVRIGVLLLVLVVMTAVSRIAQSFLTKKFSKQTGMIFRKLIFYLSVGIVAAMILNELGFKLNAILGAAGVAGVAIGFASQTTLSNFISGLFIIGEKAFEVGDVIKTGDTLGIVDSINLMSIKVKTFDNQLVRIPNEGLIKSHLTNITKFPIRRMDINVGVAYHSDLRQVMQLLKDVAKANPHALNEPEPLLIVKEFGDSSINFLLGVWFAKTDFLVLKNSIIVEIKEAFDKNGIEIPFPQRTVHIVNEAGS